jgi:hypothetical protein
LRNTTFKAYDGPVYTQKTSNETWPPSFTEE